MNIPMNELCMSEGTPTCVPQYTWLVYLGTFDMFFFNYHNFSISEFLFISLT